ncbi:MAG: hypothetical protein AB1427_04795 [Thermodesulfobacteriota bacterium]
MELKSVLEIVGYGAWNGGIPVDNSIYEKKGLSFKGGIPVTRQTIEDRIGVRSRMTAPPNLRIGRIALQNLLEGTDLDLSRIRLFIGATNVGDDKKDPGPLIQHPYGTVKRTCPQARAFDLYAGCPGFNVAVELVFMLSLTGFLRTGDISIIVGAENIHRAQAFRPDDTANIIFGDDSLATALQTRADLHPCGNYSCSEPATYPFTDDFVARIADVIFRLNGRDKIDGIIIDNQIGRIACRIPATAARVQSALVEKMYPDEAAAGHFRQFKEALSFYDRNINAFAFDLMTLDQEPDLVERIARAYVESGRYRTVASVFLDRRRGIRVKIHHGSGHAVYRPETGIVDTLTRTHGCFGSYIQAVETARDVFGEMDGKGVFLYATRGACKHLTELLQRNDLTVNDIELLIEHQANFAMIPMTLQNVIDPAGPDRERAVRDFIANKMITNIHTRGNCSVVCMQRLPYDLLRGALKADAIHGYDVNRNLEKLKQAHLIVNDSVGAGMTRSTFIRRATQ